MLKGCLILLLASVWAWPSLAQSTVSCRPAAIEALSDIELDRVVLLEISRLTEVPASELDVRKSLSTVDRSAQGVMTYGSFLLNIERLLGIRLSSASPTVRSSIGAKTVGEAYARTPISTLQTVVRSAFRNTPACGS